MTRVLPVSNIAGLGKLSQSASFRDYEFLEMLEEKDRVIPTLTKFQEEDMPVDILLISEGVNSESGVSTQSLLLNVKKLFPSLRIIYLAGNVSENDVARRTILAKLVKEGIYDIYIGEKLNSSLILDLLSREKTIDDVRDLMSFSSVEKQEDRSYSKIITCSSVKPGSGKSMLATNLAIAIAKFGQIKKNGQKPRVAIVEGDLTSLSIGTLLNVKNSQYNMRAALQQAAKVVDANGVITGSDDQIESVKHFIRKCFVQYGPVPNLYAMAVSSLDISEMININPYQYYFMIQCIVGAFDVVVVDMNSSLEHRTTTALYELAGTCYFLLDMDPNNIQNNIRYRDELEAIGVLNKVKYIVNKYVSPEEQYDYIEDLDYGLEKLSQAGLNIDRTIPFINTTLMIDSMYKGKPIVLSKNPMLKDAKDAIFEIANEQWKIDYALIEKENVVKKENKKGFGLFKQKEEQEHFEDDIDEEPAKESKNKLTSFIDGLVEKLNK